MTYGILSLESGNLVESYSTEEAALEAVVRIASAEPEALDSVAVLEFEDDGRIAGSIDGAELAKRVTPLVRAREAARAQ